MVKYGNPNGPNGAGSASQVTWPAYNTKLQSIALDVPASVVSSLQEDKCAVWDKIAAYMPPTGVRFQEALRVLTQPEPEQRRRRADRDVLIATE